VGRGTVNLGVTACPILKYDGGWFCFASPIRRFRRRGIGGIFALKYVRLSSLTVLIPVTFWAWRGSDGVRLESLTYFRR
jgi:hypothetical protein